VEPGKVAFLFERDGIPMWSGVVWGAQVSRTAQTVTFTGAGWTSVLDRVAARFAGDLSTWHADGSSASGFSEVCTGMTLLRLGGNTTVSNMFSFQSVDDRGTGITPPTSTQPERGVNNAQTLGDMLQQMAGIEFDYRWAVEYAPSGLVVKFIPYYPMMGVPLLSVLDDSSVLIDAVTTTADAVAHRLWGSPSWGGGLSDFVFTSGASLTASDGYPYYEKFMPATGGTNAETAAYLAASASRHVEEVPSLTATLLPDGVIGIGELATFHAVTVRVDDGWLSLEDTFRITSSTISVTAGTEVQTVTLVDDSLF
jgi:hypothetical protein